MRQATLEGGYEPAQYANLPVSGELKELFKTIQRYILNHSDTPHKYNNSIQNLRPSFPNLFQPLEKLMRSLRCLDLMDSHKL